MDFRVKIRFLILKLAQPMSLMAMIAAIAGAPSVATAQAVLIEISPSQSAMQVGATRSFSAHGFTAANDPVLDLVVSWRSSQPEIASADASGTVRALAPGTATITATTEEGVEGAAPVTVEAIPPRDSVTLIDDAVARGEISADDGIRYRLFAILGDAALPEAYRSDVEIGHLRMPQIAAEAVNRLDLFSPQQGELIQSLFIPPGYPGSWADRLSVTPSPPA